MSVSGELLCSFELLKPLDSTALKNHIKKGRNKRNSMLSSPVSSPLLSHLLLPGHSATPLCNAAQTLVLGMTISLFNLAFIFAYLMLMNAACTCLRAKLLGVLVITCQAIAVRPYVTTKDLDLSLPWLVSVQHPVHSTVRPTSTGGASIPSAANGCCATFIRCPSIYASLGCQLPNLTSQRREAESHDYILCRCGRHGMRQVRYISRHPGSINIMIGLP